MHKLQQAINTFKHTTKTCKDEAQALVDTMPMIMTTVFAIVSQQIPA
jgi:hypothetical protein